MSQLNEITNKLNSVLKNSPLFYLSNDPERSLGLENTLDNYHIVHIDKSQYLNVFDKNNTKYFCLEKLTDQNKTFRSSLKLLQNKETQKYIKNICISNLLQPSTASTLNNYILKYIQTFKISPAFEVLAKKLGFKVLNTSVKLNRLFEDKLSQFNELKDLDITLPETFLAKPGKISFEKIKQHLDLPFVIQFNRGHTGGGTIIINNTEDYQNLVTKNNKRTVKFSQYITGLPYTINAVIGKKETYIGGLSYQITGIPELTKFKGGTVGNDFGFRGSINKQVLNEIKRTVNTIAKHMHLSGYLGLFGLDFIVKESKVYVIEINARQPASIPLYTQLQISQNVVPLAMIHLLEFLDIKYKIDSAKYNTEALEPIDFSQVFLRADQKVQIEQQFLQGHYQYKHGKLNFINNEYNITTLKNDECVVLSPAKDRIVSFNGELTRIQMHKSVMISNDVINKDVLNIFNHIQKILKCKKY